MYNVWSKTVPYWNLTANGTSMPSNDTIASTALGILRCPDDFTARPNEGNLSYACNSGFSLTVGKSVSFTATTTEPGTFNRTINWAGTSGGTNDYAIIPKLGVMFPGTSLGAFPWDYKTSPAAIADGMSNTLLLTENTLSGADAAGTFTGGTKKTNWACPLPNYVAFIGSPYVCGSSGACAGGGTSGLSPSTTTPVKDGPGWAEANNVNNSIHYDWINYGQNLVTEGNFPFSNSGHPGGCNMVFCDGAVRFINSTIDGTVYSKILTPAGRRLPTTMRQLPVIQDQFAQ
jgi:prepilin-type processing-associated H-X9-DG protein